jgi:hypothetical protein
MYKTGSILKDKSNFNFIMDFYACSLLYGFEKWRLTENNKRRIEATETDALRRSS